MSKNLVRVGRKNFLLTEINSKYSPDSVRGNLLQPVGMRGGRQDKKLRMTSDVVLFSLTQ